MEKKSAKKNVRNPLEKRSESSEPETQPRDVTAPQSAPAHPEKANGDSLDRKGIWEVSYESGAIIGYFEGTPRHIAAFIVNTDDEGRFIRRLNFTSIPVKRLPEKLMRTLCCGRNYSKNDNFCSRCGKGLAFNTKLPSKLKLAIDA